MYNFLSLFKILVTNNMINNSNNNSSGFSSGTLKLNEMNQKKTV